MKQEISGVHPMALLWMTFMSKSSLIWWLLPTGRLFGRITQKGPNKKVDWPDKTGAELKRYCHPFWLFFIFYDIHTYIHSINRFISHHSPSLLPISSSLESSLVKAFLWWRAENRTRACLTASRLATNWVTRTIKPQHRTLVDLVQKRPKRGRTS